SPDNPAFYFLEVKGYLLQGPSRAPIWKLRPLLDKAEQLARRLPPDDKQKDLLEGIEAVRRVVGAGGPPGMGMFGEIFEQLFAGGSDGWDDDWEEDDWEEEDEMPFLPFGNRGKKKPKKRR